MARGPASFILDLFGIRTITQGFVTYDDEPYVELDPAFFSVTADPLNRRNVVSLIGAPPFTSLSGSSLTLGSQSPPQVVVSVGVATSVALANMTLGSATVPLGKTVRLALHVTASIHVAALGWYAMASWGGVIAAQNGGLALGGGSNDSADWTFMGAPFGLTASFAGLSPGISGTTIAPELTPIDLTTPFTGSGSMASGAWAQNKTVTGAVQGSGTALGIGSNCTILSAPNGRWYFYTVGTTSNAGTGPTHTSGQAADGSAVAYHGGLVSAGVPMVATVTWRQVETGP